jgi:pimeloyl-ACP methyl ester carboxylesterase
MATSLARVAFKTLTWTVGTVALLLALVVGYTLWVVYSFDTETLPAHYGQVDTELYVPEQGAARLIVGLGGAEGGNAWTSDRWSAQRNRFLEQGYAFLAVGYFGAPNTPKQLDRIALEGVHAAILKAQADARIGDDCVTVLGGSKGAELALSLAAHFPDIDAVVALAPGDTVFPAHTDAMTTSSWALDGKPLPFAPMPWSATWDLISGNLLGVMERTLAEDSSAAAAIPAERIRGPILLVSGKRDEMWPATKMSERLIARLDRHDFAYAHEHLAVDGGHTAVTDHFAEVEGFLARELAQLPACSAPTTATSAVAVAD